MNTKAITTTNSFFIKLLVVVSIFITSYHSADAQNINFDSMMRKYGMVDIQELAPGILVELKYSTTDNFVGVDMYGDLERAYLEKEFAKKVVKAQEILMSRYPHYTLLIYDAARPISTQRTMRKIVNGTEFEKFVADGTRGGRHNYGVGVDLTIATLDGVPLDMGAGFDDFTNAASVKGTPDNSDPKTRTMDVYRKYVNEMVSKGIISRKAANNRILLLEVMHEAGLYPYRREWWHYEEITPMETIRANFRMLDF